MVKLIESNLNVFTDLAFKYNVLQSFKNSNLKLPIGFNTSLFCVDPDFLDTFHFNHFLLEIFLEFKDSLNYEKLSTLPEITEDVGPLPEMLEVLSLSELICSSFGFEILDLGYTIYSYETNEQELAKDFLHYCHSDNDDIFSWNSYVVLSQTILAHPVIDHLYSENDSLKIEKFLSYINENRFDLTHFFYPPDSTSCYNLVVEILPVSEINLLYEHNLPNSKYALVLNSVQASDTESYHYLPHSLQKFTEFYKFLLSF